MFISKPFRGFAFVTFDDFETAAALMGKELEILGGKVIIGSAVPKLPPNHRHGGGMNSPGGMHAQAALDQQNAWNGERAATDCNRRLGSASAVGA